MPITAKVNFTSEDSENGFVYGTSFDITVEDDIHEIQQIADNIAKQLNDINNLQGAGKTWNFSWNVHKNAVKVKKEPERNENCATNGEFGKCY